MSSCFLTSLAVVFAASCCAFLSPWSCVGTKVAPLSLKSTFPGGVLLRMLSRTPPPRVSRKMATSTTTAATTPAMIRFRATFDRSAVFAVRPELDGLPSRSGVLSSVAKTRRGYQASRAFLASARCEFVKPPTDAAGIRCGVRCRRHAGEPGRLVGIVPDWAGEAGDDEQHDRPGLG